MTRYGLISWFLAALLIASCAPAPAPDGFDWCYIHRFNLSDEGFNIQTGSWVNGAGISTDGTGLLQMNYVHNQSVQPLQIIVTAARPTGSSGDITVTANAIVYGVGVAFTETIPAALTEGQIVITPEFAGDNGNTVNITVDASAPALIRSIEVRGRGFNPFPINFCAQFTPSPSPTGTLEFTNTPNPSSTPSPTFTVTPGPSPTPTYVYWMSDWIEFNYIKNFSGNSNMLPTNTTGYEVVPVNNWVVGWVTDIADEETWRQDFTGSWVRPAGFTSTRVAGWTSATSGNGIDVTVPANPDMTISTFAGTTGANNAGYNQTAAANHALISHPTFTHFDNSGPNTIIGGTTMTFPMSQQNISNATTPTFTYRLRLIYFGIPVNPTPTPTASPTVTATRTPLPGVVTTFVPSRTPIVPATRTPIITPSPGTPSPVAPSGTPRPTVTLIPPPTAFLTLAPDPSATPDPNANPTGENEAEWAIFDAIGDFFTFVVNATVQGVNFVGDLARWIAGTVGNAFTLFGNFLQLAFGWIDDIRTMAGQVIDILQLLTLLIVRIIELLLDWIFAMIQRLYSIIVAFWTATPTPIPGMPQCYSDPDAHDLCAVYWILHWTLFNPTSPGRWLIPTGLIVINLVAILWTVRFVMGLLGTGKEVANARS
jgi:hypothetical protein